MKGSWSSDRLRSLVAWRSTMMDSLCFWKMLRWPFMTWFRAGSTPIGCSPARIWRDSSKMSHTHWPISTNRILSTRTSHRTTSTITAANSRCCLMIWLKRACTNVLTTSFMATSLKMMPQISSVCRRSWSSPSECESSTSKMRISYISLMSSYLGLSYSKLPLSCHLANASILQTTISSTISSANVCN